MVKEEHIMMPIARVFHYLLLHCDGKDTGAFYVVTEQGHWGEFLLNKGAIVGVRYRALRGVKALQLFRQKARSAKYSFKSSGFDSAALKQDRELLPDTNKIFQFLGANYTSSTSGDKSNSVQTESAVSNARKAEDVGRLSGTSERSESASVKVFTVLVVEDSVISRRVILNTLSGKGYRILEANDGYRAIEILSREKPDLILLDLIMPGLDGYKVMAYMKKSSVLNKIPVIILTSRDSLLDKLKGKMSGSDEYLTKPFSSQDLEQKISRYLKK